MKIKRNRLETLKRGIQQALSLKGVKFVYALNRNLNKVEKEIKRLTKASNYHPEYVVYNEERMKLCEEYSNKHEEGPKKGKPIIIDDQYDVSGHQEEFDKALAELMEKHKSALDDRKKQSEEFQELLGETVEIDFFMISEERLPEDISGNQLKDIALLVEGLEVDEDEEKEKDDVDKKLVELKAVTDDDVAENKE